jgi:predicted metal-dependent enzyme (double-stranded beta helix superfamily)
MWAVIGVYTGREDNIFWRRLPDAKDGRVEAAGARALSVGDAAPLGEASESPRSMESSHHIGKIMPTC